MKSFYRPLALLAFLIIFIPATAWAKTELNLWKFSEYRYGACGFCGEFVNFSENENRAEFTDFNLYNQDGYYTAVLTGPMGTTVTLFGSQDYKTERGYLTLVKKDDALVEIEDLESFPPGTWVDREAKEGISGAYSAFYQPFPNFKENVASVKWGH